MASTARSTAQHLVRASIFQPTGRPVGCPASRHRLPLPVQGRRYATLDVRRRSDVSTAPLLQSTAQSARSAALLSFRVHVMRDNSPFLAFAPSLANACTATSGTLDAVVLPARASGLILTAHTRRSYSQLEVKCGRVTAQDARTSTTCIDYRRHEMSLLHVGGPPACSFHSRVER